MEAWHLLASAKAGRGHVKQGIPCQDKVRCCKRHGVSVAALADGAGSAVNSHFGAEFVTEAICAYISSNFNALYNQADGIEAKKQITDYLHAGLHDLSGRMGVETASLASTLLVVAVQEERYIVIHIGDGVIGYWRDDRVIPATVPQSGEFTNSTVFITEPDAWRFMQILKGSLGSVKGFVLMSDGAAASLYSRQKKCFALAAYSLMCQAAFLGEAFAGRILQQGLLPELAAMTMDDCSVAMLVKGSTGKISKQARHRYEAIIAALQAGFSWEESCRMAGIRKKYYRRYAYGLGQAGLLRRQKAAFDGSCR